MPITAVRATVLSTDVDGDGIADSGDTLSHSLIITNTEAFALLGLTIEETQTGITTVPGSVEIGPIANDDDFNMVGNTSITLNKAQLIGNDIDPDGVEANLVVTINLASDVNGTIIDNGNDTYTFTPNIGFEGTASFTYSLTDEQGVTSVAGFDGLVELNVDGMVWFIDNNAGGSTNVGTQANPFTSIASFNAVNDGIGITHPEAGDYIYLREGTGTYSAADGINLLNGQILIGQGENLVVDHSGQVADIIVETGSAGDTPVIVVTGAANQGIQLAQNNVIRGLDVGMNNATAVGIADGGGTVGNLVISNVGVGVGSSLGAAIDIDQGGTLNVLLESITSSGAGQAIDLGSTNGLQGTGNHFTVSGATQIDDASVDGIRIANSPAAGPGVTPLNATFTGKVTILNDAGGANGDGVDLQSNNGTYSFNGGVDIIVNGTDAFGFRAQSSGTVNIVDVGTTQIVSNNGTAILINPTTFNAALDTVISGDGGTGAGISLTGMSGSLTIGTVNISGQATNGIAVANSAGSLTVNGGSIGTGDASNDAVNVSGGTGAITINASITKTTDGNVVDVSGHSGGTISFGGAINATGNGTGITLVNNTGGAINFTNAAVNLNTATSTALNFTNTGGTGATVSLSGGSLAIDTTSGIGINATSTTTGAGSLIISGANNSVQTTSGGRAIILDGVTANAQFLEVDYAGGSNTAIFLRNTGATGSFSITGTGSTANSGGDINMSAGGADGSITQGIGVYLENASNVSLSNMDFDGTFSQFGIRGLNVNNFTLRDSDLFEGVTAFGTLSNATLGEGAIKFGTPGGAGTTGLSGTGLFEGNVIGNGRFDNLAIWNYGANTLNLTIQDSANDQAVFNPNLASFGSNEGLFVETGGTHDLTMLVQGVQFTGVVGDHIQTNAVSQAGGSQNITINNNIFSQSLTDAVAAGGGIRIGGGSTVAGTSLDVDYVISNNVMTGSKVSTMDLRFNGLGGDINGVVLNNTIGTNDGVYSSSIAQRGAGDNGAYGIWTGIDRNTGVAGDFVTLNYATRIEGNTIRDTNAGSILVWSNNGGGEGTVRVEATIQNNNMAEYFNDAADNGALSGVYFSVGGGGAGDDALMGIRMLSNVVNATTALDGFAAVILAQGAAGSHFYIPGVPGTPISGSGYNATISNYWVGAPNNNSFTNPPGIPAPFVLIDNVAGLGNEAFTLGIPIMAAPQPGVDWETAIRDWLANYQPPAPPTGDTGSGGGGGDGGSGDGDPGPGDPPPPPEPPHPVIVDDGVLSQAELDYFVEAAIQRWIDAGATAAQVAEMRATAVSVADMSGSYLGTSDAVSIRIDSNGAGYGWFLDRTPGDDSEYHDSGSQLSADTGGPADGTMDLLTVLMHEFGHQVGLDDTYAAGDADELMYGYANLGERRLPRADDLADAGPGLHLHESFLLAPVAVGTLPAGKAVRILWDSTVDDFVNQFIPTLSYFSTISGSNFPTFNSNTENLTIDTLTLTGTIWHDNGDGGGIAANGIKDGTEGGVDNVTVSIFVDVDDDDVPDTPGTALGSALTAGGGIYTFAGLAQGNYIVRVDQTNFDAGGALQTMQNSPVSTPEPVDPDDNADNDDNGARVLGQPAWSNTITLDFDSETVDDGTGQFDINDTLDFGFFGNSPPVLADLGGDTASFTEGGAAVILDDSSAPELAATVSDVNQAQLNGGTLTVSITANEDVSEDELRIDTSGTVSLSAGFTVGSNVSVGGLQIGTLTADGNGGDDLVIALNTTDATLANVSTLIQSLTYFNLDTLSPSTAARTVSVTIADGLGGSDTETVTVNVTAVSDDPPSGTDDTLSVDEDGSLPLLAADFGFSDPDSDQLLEVQINSVTGGKLFLSAVEITTFPTTVGVADLAGNLTFEPDPDLNGPGAGSIDFQVVDDSGDPNDTDLSENTLTIDVNAINDQPDVPASLADVNATEQTLVSIPGITLSDVDLDARNGGNGDYDGATFIISQAVPAATDSFSIDATGASFTINGSNLEAGGLVFATFGTVSNIFGIEFTSSGTPATTALVNEVLGRIQYTNTSDDPPATVQFVYGIDDGAPGGGQGTVVGGNNVDGGTVDVNISAVNDQPTLIATGNNPTFTEGDSGSDLFDSVTASTIEAGQTFTGMTITVTNVTDGADEELSIDGSTVTLTSGMFIGTANNGLTINVALVGTTATLSFTGATLSASQIETLIDDLDYYNGSEDPTDANRVVTITELVDSGSNSAPNDNTTTLAIASTVDVVPVNDAGDAVDSAESVAETGTLSDSVDATDVDGVVVTAVNGVGASVGTEITLASGAKLTLNADGTYDYDPDGNFGYLISAAKGLATGAVNISAIDSFTYTLDSGDTATVTITVEGVDNLADQLRDDAGNNTITGTAGPDLFVLFAGGTETVAGGAGDSNDRFYFGNTFDTTDSVDGGLGEDSLILGGDYDYTFGALQLVGIERLRLLHDTVGGDFDYTFHMIDANVAAGTTLQVNALDLLAGEDLVFDGHFETNGKYLILSGGGNDTLVGGQQNDDIIGGAGNDLIFALPGNDRIAGGLGADQLIGGTGADTFLYAGAADSTGLQHDVLNFFEPRIDKIDLPGTWAGWATSVGSGTLDSGSFDTDLAAAVDANLGANQSILFTPNAGSFAGSIFVVVDGNGDGNYTAGADYVLEFTNPVEPLTSFSFVV